MKVNPKHLEAIMKAVNASPYFSLLGIKITELASRIATVELEVEKKHLNPFGSVHGGVYASLIDTAAYWAAYYDQKENVGFTSRCIGDPSCYGNRREIARHGKSRKRR